MFEPFEPYMRPPSPRQVEFPFMESQKLFPTFAIRNMVMPEEDLFSADYKGLRAFLDSCRRPGRRY